MKKDEHSIKASETDQVNVSIIIPFRNEDGKIQVLLDQLLDQISKHEGSEIILVNDHSTDNALQSLDVPNSDFTLLHSEHAGKKQALSKGIHAAKNKWIVTLDADVLLPNRWMECITKTCANALTDMIILPVEIFPTPKFFQKLEALEFTVLQGITFSYAYQNQPFLANGAHLAFRKKAFLDFNGYQSHEHMASGDDVFLLEELSLSNGHSVGYSYYGDMSVSTHASGSFRELLYQKVRWSKKTFQFKSTFIKHMGVLILMANFGLIALLFSGFWKIFLLGFFIKSICDLYLVLFPLTLRSRKTLLKYIPLFMVVYPFYITFVSIATLVIKPTWKGRKI